MPPASSAVKVPLTRAQRWTRPLAAFLAIESASGVALFLCTLGALVAANSAYAESFAAFWETECTLSVGPLALRKTLLHVVNDGFMTIFFFLVGLEIKRELVSGELRDPRKAALPVAAALGGMLAPAAIYYALQHGQPGERGWGVPMATDIAFVVGVLAVLGPRVPLGLKILLLSLAIADDIGAVVVIAIFYSTSLSLPLLMAAAAGFLLIALMRHVGVRAVPPYFLVGTAIWLAVLKSGIHPTVAGVVLGLMTPAVARLGSGTLVPILGRTLALVRTDPDHGDHERSGAMSALAYAAKEAISPLQRLESALHPWVGFVIMPVFAVANAGVAVEWRALQDPVAVAVALGLFLGKPLGVVGFSWLSVKLGICRLPDGVSWRVLLGGGFLAGIGFTMSLFVAGLALHDDQLAAGKIGTLCGSMVSGLVGAILLWFVLPARAIRGTIHSPA